MRKHVSSLMVAVALAIASQASSSLIAEEAKPVTLPPSAPDKAPADAKESDLIGHWVLDAEEIGRFFDKELARTDLKNDDRNGLEMAKPMLMMSAKQMVMTIENGQWTTVMGGREQVNPYTIKKIEGNLFTVVVGKNPEAQFKIENGRLIPQEPEGQASEWAADVVPEAC